MKRTLSVLLLICMFVSLLPAAAFAVEDAQTDAQVVTEAAVTEEAAVAEAEAAATESSLKAVFNSKLYVEKNEAAGLAGRVDVKLDLIGATGTLYLPGKTDASQLFFSWEDTGITVSKDGVVFENGAAPVAPAGESVTYKITKGYAFAYLTVKTVKGSVGVEPMFLELDGSQGTIEAMNADETHETKCVGNVVFDGETRAMTMKGRGNSTWGLPKKPYNITLKDDAELIPGAGKAEKWSLLANYFDNSLIRNKIAMDLASQLGIGLPSRFVDIWMNGEYLGNYLMTPKSDYKAPKGGFHLENDNYLDSEDPQFKIPGMYAIGDTLNDDGYYNMMTIKKIGKDAKKAGWDAAKVEAYFTEAWNALEDFDSENYQNYFDLDSWAKMFLMYEVSKTYDCFAGSLLMHRDNVQDPNSKLVAGPAWDYDVAFGRTLHKFLVGVAENVQLNAEGWYNDSIGLIAVDKPVSLLQELGKHASFMRHVAKVYTANQAIFEDIAANVDRQRDAIRASALMNNVLWGTHSLSAEYVIAPNTMSLLGTGKYALHYEVTLNWDSYVNNLREFCAKRVMWLSDHLWQAEAPQGSIVKKTSESGVVLQAVLTAGNQKNSYQWQVLEGETWTDIPGATADRYAPEAEAAEYRCVVKNAGAVITTVHGGCVATETETALDPAVVTVGMEKTALSNGELTLALDGKEIGEYTFQQVSGGWTIQNAAGKYLAVSGCSVAWKSDPVVWRYENGVFTATASLARTALGWLITLGYQRDVSLTVSGGSLAVTTGSGAAAAFLKPVAE
ncbi:MAG: CotH kinase family protein [Oscillospiraceae bacterium]|nr:CotH kinase family protein [Oscillospiraceae bacterium]